MNCYAHILNLVVEDSIKANEEEAILIEKYKRIVETI